jgi:ClpP class serine protease
LPSWNQILVEITAPQNQGPARFDQVRRKYLTALSVHTGRHTILYATRWLQGAMPGAESLVSIVDEDVQGLMATVQGRTSADLDLILHSPGGSPEAAESVVHYLRSEFKNIRVIVPHLAMSAATMIACAANRVVMGPLFSRAH